MSISLYIVSVLVYLTGLSPSVNLYNGTTFALYALAVMPVLLFNIIFSMLSPSPYYVLADLLLAPVSLFLLGKSFGKWDGMESPRF